MMTGLLLPRDSEEFRAGMMYAAQVMLQTIGHSHGGSWPSVAVVEPKLCCRRAVVAFALGAAAGLNDAARDG